MAARRGATALAGRLLLQPQQPWQQLRHAEAAAFIQTIPREGGFCLTSARGFDAAQPSLRNALPSPTQEAAQRPAGSSGASESPSTSAAAAKAAVSFYKRQLPRDVVAFASPEGRHIFKAALDDGSAESFFPLVQHFTTQNEPASCALGTLCMVLNALAIDPGQSWKGVWRWWDEEILLKRWEQAAHTLPAGQRRTIADVREAGMSLAEFVALAKTTGLFVRHKSAGDSSYAEFKEAVHEALGCGVGCDDASTASEHRHNRRGGRGGTHLVVSFHRKTLGQTGEGHFSPLGGYSRRHNAVLVMDVARFKYPPYWVKLPDLWEAMTKSDPVTGKPRGYVVLKSQSIPMESERCPVNGLAAVEEGIPPPGRQAQGPPAPGAGAGAGASAVGHASHRAATGRDHHRGGGHSHGTHHHHQ